MLAALMRLDIAARPLKTLYDDLAPRFFFTGVAGLFKATIAK